MDQYEKLLEAKSNRNQLLMDHLNNKYYLLVREIQHLLEQGLKERIQLLCPLPSINPTNKTVRRLSAVFDFYYFGFSVASK